VPLFVLCEAAFCGGLVFYKGIFRRSFTFACTGLESRNNDTVLWGGGRILLRVEGYYSSSWQFSSYYYYTQQYRVGDCISTTVILFRLQPMQAFVLIIFIVSLFSVGALTVESPVLRLKSALRSRCQPRVYNRNGVTSDRTVASRKSTFALNSFSEFANYVNRLREFSSWDSKRKAENESAIEALKVLIFDAAAGCKPNGLEATQSQRTMISDLVSQIEALNPTPRPAYSPLMNGFWRMLYTDFSPPAPSAGKLGPFVGDVFQDLDSTNSIIRNVLRINTPPIRGQLTATQRVRDPKTWYVRQHQCLFTLQQISSQHLLGGSALTSLLLPLYYVF
jgi:PAP_fibrillin